MSRFLRVIAFLPYVVTSIVHVVLLFAGSAYAAPTKLLLMPLLAVAVVVATVAGSTSRVRPLPLGAMLVLLLAIMCSWLGDGAATFFPMFADELPMMLLCFGLAHVLYVLLMWRGAGIARGGFPRWAVVYVVAYVGLMSFLVPHTGALTVPVLLYGVLLAATAAFASRCGPVIAWGGVWFLVSDAILAFRIFVPEAMPGWTSGMVMLTYTFGQGLLVWGIVAALRNRGASDRLGQGA
ncbi:MAG: lysoplasmalogenase family protein [Leucobacter sp.]